MGGLDDEFVPVPVGDGVAHGRMQQRLRHRESVHVYLSIHAIAFPVDREILRPVKNLDGKRCAPDDPWHARPDTESPWVVIGREFGRVPLHELRSCRGEWQRIRRATREALRKPDAREIRPTCAGLRQRRPRHTHDAEHQQIRSPFQKTRHDVPPSASGLGLVALRRKISLPAAAARVSAPRHRR